MAAKKSKKPKKPKFVWPKRKQNKDLLKIKAKLSNEDVIYGTCGNHAYQAVKILNRDNDGGYGYDEVLHMYGCASCITARCLKIEMGFIGTKLGQIRGAITRVGRKLNNP